MTAPHDSNDSLASTAIEPTPPPLPAMPAPDPYLARFGSAAACRWKALSWRGKSLLALAAYSTLIILVIVFGGRAQKAPHDAANPETVNASPDDDARKPRKLEGKPDYSDRDMPAKDPRIAEAYQIHRRFVMEEFGFTEKPITFQPDSKVKRGFSPPDETRIIRKGNLFRIKGWIKRVWNYDPNGSDSKDIVVRTDYVCEVQYDPELDVWRRASRVQQIGQ
jgi:hypothetical protein